jgi:hypothetical protein
MIRAGVHLPHPRCHRSYNLQNYYFLKAYVCRETILFNTSRAEQSRAEQSRAEQSRAEQSRAEQSRAEQSLDGRKGNVSYLFYILNSQTCLLIFGAILVDYMPMLSR